MSSFSTYYSHNLFILQYFCKIVAHRSLFGAAKILLAHYLLQAFLRPRKEHDLPLLLQSPFHVTIAIVIPVVTNDFITSNTSFTISGSSADVGSSNNITSGSIANALAIATRCFCPPERRFGYVSFYLLVQPFLKVSQLSFQLLASLPLLHW